MTTMTTPPEPYQHGSYLPWEGVAPPLPRSIANSTNSPSIIGASWPRSTDTTPWMSSAKRSPVKLISLNRSSRRPEWNDASVNEGLKQPGWTVKSRTYDLGRQGPGRSRTASERTWYARTVEPAMDVGVHSDKGCGVTGLGRAPPL